MAFVQSIVLRERSLKDINPALGSQHSDLHHRFFVIHLSDGKAETVEYGHFEGSTTGTIRIHDGPQLMHAMLEAHEFEVEHGKGYAWAKFKHWILHDSGYQNTPWTRDHQSETFNALCLDHLLKHTVRPARIAELAGKYPLALHEPNDDAKAVFHAVKHAVIKKFHELHNADLVHHTHIFTEASHLEAYKLVQYAVREVDYGFIYFGKVNIGGGHFLHIRAHKYHDASIPIEFHSIRMTRDCGIWAQSAELVYFEE